MSLIETWSPYFDTHVRMRGRACQADGKVTLVEAQDGELVRADVQGTESYVVTIRDGQTARVSCTCPFFAGGSYCKHIWATLLEVQQGGGSTPVILEQVSPSPPKARKRSADRSPTRDREPDWMGRLSLLQPAGFAGEERSHGGLPTQRQICYVVNPELSRQHNGLVIELRQRQAGVTGWSRLKRFKINTNILDELTDPIDRELCALLMGATWVDAYDSGDVFRGEKMQSAYRLPSGAARHMLRRMIDTGRCLFHDELSGEVALQWDGDDSDAAPWVLWIVGHEADDGLDVGVEFRRGEKYMAVNEPDLVLYGGDGMLIYDGKVAPLDDRDASRWIGQFRNYRAADEQGSTMHVPAADVERFLDRLYLLANLPEIDLPPGVGRAEQRVELVPYLDLLTGALRRSGLTEPAHSRHLVANVWFAYRHHHVTPIQRGRFVGGPAAGAQDGEEPPDDAPTELIRRDIRREQELLASLAVLGFRRNPMDEADPEAFAILPVRLMPAAVSALVDQGWVVRADSKAIRNPGTSSFRVTSGVDWFELHGTVRYQGADGGEQEIPLPQILAAARAGQTMITLADGSQGMLPQEWLEQHGLLTALGEIEADHIRFKSSQAAMLDSLLARQQVVDVDERFAEARRQLREFDGIHPVNPPKAFHGTLRHYQCDGLGWLLFLRKFGMGGILADDMGLGKTVQVLALLDVLHEEAKSDSPRSPTLIVVPRSVVFNWIDESKRFSPTLRVLVYHGPDRDKQREAFGDYDVIVTSYGLMRRDIKELCKYQFDCVVLDEAQAIKNPASQSAKAARLIQAQHRLALTGTPVENHLGDLWSIFEFLNPGMLGSSARFAGMIRSGLQVGNGKNNATRPGAAGRAAVTQIADVLRPFILRRTKKQVLDELPEKTEQTIYCEMDTEQRNTYNELRKFYRGSLLQQLDETGTGRVSKSSMMVLEALLRLRQAACHPALIDKKRAGESSAKMDVLLVRLNDLIEEGHKALVFSQFTSMLKLVRSRLDEQKITYEYLDGQTRDRRRVVERFQTDPDCPVFLISLKAGGLGLNLTAAEYVFILDPWWNPAVEQQAIDRAHRIGQTRHVFAYRLICQDTVEQRIAELQNKKKQLADAIIGGQNNLLRNLTRDDLERLLS